MTRKMTQPTHRPRGFTLIEVLVCTVLIVVAFTALLVAFGQDSRAAMTGDQITVATYLADEIRDAAPADGVRRRAGPRRPHLFAGRPQHRLLVRRRQLGADVTVTPLSDVDLNQTVAAAGADACRITVTVKQSNVVVVTQTYYMMDQSSVPYTTRAS